MACDANGILSAAASKGLLSLDGRTILLGIIGSLNTAAGSPTANSTLASSALYGFESLEDKSLYAVLAAYLSTTAATNLPTAISSAASNKLLDLDDRLTLIGILEVLIGANTLTQVISIATSKGFQGLQERQLVESIAQLTIQSSGTLQSLLNTAESGGFFKVSHDTIMGVILQLYCQGSSGPPAAPVATAGTNAATDQFQANWSASAGATSYRLDVSTSNVFASFVPGYNDLNVGNVLNTTVTGLSANTTYFYRVRAVNGSGTSGNSNTISLATLPVAPVATSQTSLSCDTFSANWSAAAGATSYRLDVSTDPAFGSFVAGYNNLNVGNVVTAVVTPVVAGQTFYFRVRTVTATGTSANSNTISFFLSSLLCQLEASFSFESAPAGVTSSNVGGHTMSSFGDTGPTISVGTGRQGTNAANFPNGGPPTDPNRFQDSDNSVYLLNTGQRTISFWARQDGGNDATLMGMWNDADTTGSQWRIVLDNVLHFIFHWVDSGGTPNSQDLFVAEEFTWHMYTFTFDVAVGTIEVFYDGVSVAVLASLTVNGTVTDPFSVGSTSQTNGNDGWEGLQDEVSSWNRILTNAEITELYDSGIGKIYPFT